MPLQHAWSSADLGLAACSWPLLLLQALNTTGNGKKQQRKKTKEATSELAAVHSGVDKAVQKLENVTATLGATASRMRNETKAAAAAAAAVAAGDAAGGSEGAAAVQQQQQLAAKDQGQQQQAAMQQHQHMETQQQEQQTQAQQKKQQQPTAQGTDQQGQEQQHAGGGAGGAADAAGSTAATNSSSSTGSSSNTTSSSSAGSAAHTGVVRAAEAAISKFHSAVRKDTPPRGNNKSGGGSDDVAEALEKVASTANDTLTAVRQSQAALEAAAADAAALPQRKGQAKVGSGQRESRRMGMKTVGLFLAGLPAYSLRHPCTWWCTAHRPALPTLQLFPQSPRFPFTAG